MDGAGKTHFADALARLLDDGSDDVHRVSIDDFHNPRKVRYQQGRESPAGFLEDSFDVDALVDRVLRPAGPGGSRSIIDAVFDHRTDTPRTPTPTQLADSAIVILDGVFLHQPAILPHLDLTVWLDVPFEVSVKRMAHRNGGDPSPAADANRRYVEGQMLYLARDQPREQATVVVDNTDWSAPRIMRLPDS